MKDVLPTFLEIVSNLNKKNIIPIIYGSFGLYLILNKEAHVDDLDFIIVRPDDFPICRNVLGELGFNTDPDHDRELIRNNFYISFIDKADIEKLIDETIKLNLISLNETSFFNIDIKQYLKIYKKGLENKFRKEKKETEDLKKIREIEDYLN
ncbi:MAG: hypothetical protein WCW47_00370 [Candidatus Paceibacterota bacterium]|jgi:hypothetical protein